MNEGRRSIRVYHNNPDRQLSKDEASTYLATGTLPEELVLRGAAPDFIEKFREYTREQRAMTLGSSAALWVAVGRMVHHEAAVPGSTRFPAWDGWEPVFGLRVEITPYNWANDRAGLEDAAEIQLHMGGKGLSIEDSRWMTKAMYIAFKIAQDADIQVSVMRTMTRRDNVS